MARRRCRRRGFFWRIALDQRRDQIAKLTHQRNELKQQVDLLDPNHADPDLSGELIRKNLNVLHPDEVVLILKPGS